MTASAASAAHGAQEFPYNVVNNQGFLKPDMDERSYRYIRLPNQLDVLLIHSPQLEKAGACLDVNVGSSHDPKNLLGLAHFCEHLLFMGTSKFPEENEYQKYLSTHMGSSNAYTSAYTTCYYFEVAKAHFEGALDRFSQFFISPLFSEDCQDREINAIHSEHAKNIDSDPWRGNAINNLTANPDHPITSFSTGNLETLKHEPAKYGINPRDELLKWYKTYYSSNIMKACIMGSQSLDELANLAAKYFSPIENRKVDILALNRPCETINYYTPKQLTKIVKIKPVKNSKSLRIRFYLPLDEFESYNYGASSYITHLMGHEAEGSLFHYLKMKKHWVNALTCSSRKIYDKNYLFDCAVELTNEGLKKVNEILGSVFQYIKFLNSIPEESYKAVFQEMCDLSEIKFKFKETSSYVTSVVSRNASRLHDRNLNDDNIHKFLRQYMMSEKTFNYESLKRFLSYLRPDNFLVFQMYQQFKDEEVPLVEKWYGARYNVADLDQTLIDSLYKVDLLSEFALPPLPNPYIPKNFTIQNEDLRGSVPKLRPRLVENTGLYEFWLKRDDRFFSPKGIVDCWISLPNGLNSPVNMVMLNIFKELFSMKINEFLYLTELACSRTDMITNSKGIEFSISGYSHKIPVIFETILQKLAEFQHDEEFFNQTKFDLVKHDIIKRFKNFQLLSPYAQLDSHFQYLLQENIYKPNHKLEYLVNEDGTNNDDYINFETFTHFARLIFKQAYVTVLICGNFKDEAVVNFKTLLLDNFINKVGCKQISSSQNLNLVNRTTLLSKGSIHRYEMDVDNTNSCINYFFQFENSYKMFMDLQHKAYNLEYALKLLALELLRTAFKEPFFDQLRTKEQLGYIVFSSIASTRSVHGYRIMVQSSVKSCAYLEYRIKECLNNQIKKEILGMTDEEFDKKIESLTNGYKHNMNFKNLFEESSGFGHRLFGGMYQFNINHLKLQILPYLTKEKVISVFEEYFLNESTSKRLVLHMKGRNERATDAAPEDLPLNFPEGKLITDVNEFKNVHAMSSNGIPLFDIDYYRTYHESDDDHTFDPKL